MRTSHAPRSGRDSPRDGCGGTMYAPERGLSVMKPSTCSMRSAARMTRSLTPYSAASARDGGRRSPPTYRPTCIPLTIRSLRASVTASRDVRAITHLHSDIVAMDQPARDEADTTDIVILVHQILE